MTKEELFLAIGEVEGSRLLRSELTVQKPSESNTKEEPKMTKKRIRAGRLLRNAVAAVALVFTLATTAYAVVGYVIYDSPQEMVSAIFGNKTGYDHKDITYWSDPEKPGSQYTNPAYDRVPVDETVLQEDILPYVSPVGQSISWYDYTMTVDALLYDHATKTGMLTYLIENPEGIAPYEVQNNGEVWFPGGELVQVNQYWKNYIVEEKTTDTTLAVACYFKIDDPENKNLELTFYDYTARYSEKLPSYEELMEQIKRTVTPEEALLKLQQKLGDERYAEVKEMVTQAELEDTAYMELTGEEYGKIGECPDKIVIDCSREQGMDHVTMAEGAVTISPICFQIDVEPLEFLHVNSYGDQRIHGENVDSVVIRYADGTQYIVHNDTVENTVFGLIEYPADNVRTEQLVENEKGESFYDQVNSKNCSILTYMFNRIIDVDQIKSVVVNGVELPVD